MLVLILTTSSLAVIGPGGQSSKQPTSAEIQGIPPSNVITTRIYDLFNVPLGDWWQDRYMETVIHNSFPYTYEWLGTPTGNDWIHSDYRMNVTARYMSSANTTVNPVYVPITNPNPLARGGNIRLDWIANYIDSNEVIRSGYPGQIPIWYDGWYFRLNGTVTMDKVAAKMVLNLTDSDFDNFSTWKASEFPSFKSQYSSWLLNEMNAHWTIDFAYEYSGALLYEKYSIDKIGNEVVLTIDDCLSWGMESLLGRWWRSTFLSFEGWPEDVHFTADIGPLWSAFNLDMAVQYSLVAKTSTRGNQSCWAFESSHADAIGGTSSHYVNGAWMNYSSEINPYTTTSGYWNFLIANANYGSLMPYDYTPWAWNLSANQKIVIEWPSSDQIIGYNFSGVADYSDSYIGGVFPLWVEPIPNEVPSNVDIDPASRKITITGPLDVWSWSKNSAGADELKENWTRVGLLPRGCPYIEFAVGDMINTAPSASFTITPASGDPDTVFFFNAGSSYDNEDPASSLWVSWDWDGDGVWDTAASKTKTASHQFASSGTYNVRLKVMDTEGVIDTAVTPLVVSPIPPPSTSASCQGTLGENGWYVSPVNLTLVATSPNGVNWTKYRVDGGSWATYASALTFSTDGGSIEVEYYSQDLRGNTEAANVTVLKIDTVAPVSTAYASGATVTITSTDATSGLNVTKYRIDGGTWADYGGPFNVTGSHTIEYYSIDNAGNEGAANSISVDAGIGALFSDASLLILLAVIVIVAAILIILYAKKRKQNGNGLDKPPV